MDCYQKLRRKLFLLLDFERIGDLSDAVIRKEVKIVIDHLVDDRFPHVDENELQAAQQRLKSKIETFTKEKFVQSCQQYRKDLPPPRGELDLGNCCRLLCCRGCFGQSFGFWFGR